MNAGYDIRGIFKDAKFDRKFVNALDGIIGKETNKVDMSPEQKEGLTQELSNINVPAIGGDIRSVIPHSFYDVASATYYDRINADSYKYRNHPALTEFEDKLKSGNHFYDLAQPAQDNERTYDLLGRQYKNKRWRIGYQDVIPIQTINNEAAGPLYIHGLNTINLTDDKSATPHEGGHGISYVYNMTDKDTLGKANIALHKHNPETVVPRDYGSDDTTINSLLNAPDAHTKAGRNLIANLFLQQQTDPWRLRQIYPNAFGIDKRFNNVNNIAFNILQEEGRASELGSRLPDRNKVDAKSAYDMAFGGYSSYALALADRMNIFSPKDLDAIQNAVIDNYTDSRNIRRGSTAFNNLLFESGSDKLQSITPRRMAAPMPVYTTEDQARAIQEFRQHELLRKQHPYVMKQWGDRPQNFRNEGLWLPGMEPITEAEKKLHDYAYGNTPGSFNNTPYYRYNLRNGNFINDIMNRTTKPGEMLLKPEQREYNKLMNTRTWQGYDTIADRMSDFNYAYLSANSPEEAKENFLNFVNSRKDIYVTPETIGRDIQQSYNTARGFYPDLTIPTPRVQQQLHRISVASPEELAKGRNMAKSIELYFGTGSNHPELIQDRFTKPLDLSGYQQPYTPAHRPKSNRPPYNDPNSPNLQSLSNAGRTYNNYGHTNGTPSRTSFTNPGSSYNNTFNNSTSTLNSYRRR